MARPERVEAALFDFDGTLCDTEHENLLLVGEILRGMGADVPFEVLQTLSGGEDRVTVPPIMERYGARGTIDDYERVRDGCYRTYSEGDLVLEPGATDLLAALRARGTKLALVSTTVSRCILTAFNRLGLLPYFDVVVCGDMVSRCKPDPEPYLTALDRLGVGPERAVVFEDSPTGIAAAKAAGCYVMAYSGCSVEQDVSAADEVADSFVGFEL